MAAKRLPGLVTVDELKEDPLFSALPVEIQAEVEKKIQKYESDDPPSLGHDLFPEKPLPGEEVVPEPLPKRPPRRQPGPNYHDSGSQPKNWVQQSIAQSRVPDHVRSRPPPKAPADRPAWQSSPSGNWGKPVPFAKYRSGKTLTQR